MYTEMKVLLRNGPQIIYILDSFKFICITLVYILRWLTLYEKKGFKSSETKNTRKTFGKV